MAVYNSSIGTHEDDSDITIINPSIVHEHSYEQTPPIEDFPHRDNSNIKSDYVVIYHDPKENAKQLEQILAYYILDLKQETNTQLACDNQLITRIMNLIRPAYADDQQKMIELDCVIREIASLNDKRHVEQKEKVEVLRTEIFQLNKMLMTMKNDESIYNRNNRASILTTLPQRCTINEYDQWTEIEDDTKKLHSLVESQRGQINEICSLISQAAQELPADNAPTTLPESETIDKNAAKTPTNTATNPMSSLLMRIQQLVGHQTQQEPVPIATPQEPVPIATPQEPVPIATPQEPVPVVTSQNRVLENHSPGTSPTQSLATLILSPFQPAAVNQTQEIEEHTDKPDENPAEIVKEQLPPTNIPIIPKSSNDNKKCPICNEEFPAIITDEDMYDHIDKCLFASNMSTQPSDYECPNCNRKMPDIDEAAYLQHLTDCFNRFV